MSDLKNNAFALNEVLEGNEGYCVVRDGHHRGTAFVWHDDSEWIVSDLENGSCRTVARIAVVTTSADADLGLNQKCIACDFEVLGGEWVVDAENLDELEEVYGGDLVVLWRQPE